MQNETNMATFVRPSVANIPSRALPHHETSQVEMVSYLRTRAPTMRIGTDSRRFVADQNPDIFKKDRYEPYASSRPEYRSGYMSKRFQPDETVSR